MICPRTRIVSDADDMAEALRRVYLAADGAFKRATPADRERMATAFHALFHLDQLADRLNEHADDIQAELDAMPEHASDNQRSAA